MSGESAALRAIKITREVLARAFDDLPVLMQLFELKTNPEALEDWIASVLEYIDRTAEEESGPEQH